MFEPYFRTPPLRLPIVMSLVTRDGITPQSVWGGQQDAMTVREVGWIQMYCETNQEILDTIIMAYKIAENRDVMLPVNVCHDGNYLSYGVEKVEVPDSPEVDAFLGEKNTNWHVALDPERPMAVDPLTGGATGIGPALFARYRKGNCRSMQNALKVIENTHAEWGHKFGRQYAPLVEEYRLDDADYAIVTIGGMTGAGKDAVDAARENGEKAGLIKVKTFRPYPQQAILNAVSKVKAVGIVDRAVSFGWNSGPVFQELLATLYRLPQQIPAISFIGGLAGADITIDHFRRVIATTAHGLDGDVPEQPIWINEKD
jgi:pyruvate ferredoxin oxidoreductase alpha subunit/phenylglyoxylate dehydrogenase alpha subunit